ncbi:MAG: site-specific integrase [Sedimentisphaerales bacterium]|nr:site-specific integrase [Sedimentisphaerales bacterium]
MNAMKKIWVYKRKDIKGWWVGWYESGKRKAKALPSKELAEHFKYIKYTQLNSDVFTGQVLADWSQMIGEYREVKKVQGVTEGTLYEIALSLRNFERLVGKCNSKQISQNSIDKFILQRGTEVSRPTLNKDIRNLKTFVNWCRKKRYINNEIELRELKEEENPVRSLNDVEIKILLKATKPYPSMKIRVLLALATGLRRGDIDSLKISDIDFERNCIATTSRKTKKSMASRPVSAEVMAELSKYVYSLDVGREKLLKTKFSHRKWRKICKRAGLADLKFHDLRKTFCSLLAQNGISTAVTQRLLEHSSANLTNKVYTNVDPVLRHAVEQLPVGKWL